ncbi:isochorismate synthase [Companilactobacillus ginsenosidimutans]|uniref:isochorismate synthase n=1 Tax=Companilactobacillus ginsenosidimutans TaxID=1007676 RepID=UPI00065FAFB8|nr:isochorismate synthase [Companilactobacillus ginsenosidimutans]
MLNVRQVHGNWNSSRIQQIVDAALEQEIFSYFESSDRKTQWIGIGSTSRFYPEDTGNRFSSVEKWFDNVKSQLPTKIDRDAIAILGGFSFDKNVNHNTPWKKWSAGVFVLPRIIVKVTSKETTISEIKKHKFSNDTIEDVLNKVIEMSHSSAELKNFQTEDLDKDWNEQVDKLVDSINESKSLKKVVLGRFKQGEFDGNINAVETLKALRALNKTTYHFMLKIKEQLFISATPERLFLLDGKRFSTAAIAGTIGRGDSEQEDNTLALKLYKDDKNRQEHQIVVNEISSRVKGFSTDVDMNETPMILKNQTVQHLYTPIQANVSDNADAFVLVEKMHPTPALGGMPSKETMSIIRNLESQPRVLFGAPIGYITFEGNAEMIVGIRSMYVHFDQFLMFAGAGIMPDSVGESEVKETELKFQPMIRLLQYLEERK